MKKMLILLIVIFSGIDLLHSQIDIVGINGKAQIVLVSKGEKNWKAVYNKISLFDRDKIRTGNHSSLKLRSKSYNITVFEKSVVTLDKVSKKGSNQTEIYIIKGRIRVKSTALVQEERIFIRTRNSEISPSGTDFVIDFNGIDNTTVYVFEGKVKAVNPNQLQKPVRISAYETSSIKGNGPPSSPAEIPDNILTLYNIPPRPKVIQPASMPEPEIKKEPAKRWRTPINKPVKKEPPKPAVKTELKPKPASKQEAKPKPKSKPKPQPKPKPQEKEEPWCKDPKLEFKFNFDLNFNQFNGINTIGLALSPEFKYCRIGLGLYLPIYWIIEKYPYFSPRKSWYNFKDWDFSSPADSAHDLWIKISYISYGKKGDSLYIRIGGLSGVSFGNGYILNEYSNMLNFPTIRKSGLLFDFIYDKSIGIETIIGNLNQIRSLKLYGGRFFVFPFFFNKELGILNKLQIGFTLMHDKFDEDDNRIINWGLDSTLPIAQGPIFSMKFGLDWATYSVKSSRLPEKDNWTASGNSGFGAGFRGKLVFLKYKAEYRYLSDGYIPEYFDTSYDVKRPDKFNELIKMYTNPTLSSENGYLVQIGAVFAGAGEFGASFQEYYDENGNTTDNKAKIYLTVKKGVIPKIYGTGSYIKYKVAGFSGERGLFGKLYTPNTILTFNGGVQLKSFIYVTISYKKTFKYVNGTLKGDETVTFGTSMGF